ncbi:Sexual differentiation process protein isp4 [Sphaceloma murrayae]|uniref:Sexual differentiation process protein isp4 n=1 Tax=Sphaceloma murrayae TaxID=2082308 RepID=A0A2K1QJY8_9PEZI|nr:Sexual differentiation process protein isp4 [Sphaceloma murrayae]
MTLGVNKPHDELGLTLEAWAGGFMTGSLVIMACITVANMRRKVLLHKLILIELIFGMFQGTSIFPDPPYYGWYLATGGIFLNTSWTMHNVIAWMKNKPFLSRKASLIYICSVIAVQPYWIVEMVAAFLYFNNYNNLFTHTRPWEALFRDPWWIFTSASLLWNIKCRYDFSLLELVRVSPRFGVLLIAMVISIIFIVIDILSVTHVIYGRGSPDGINPYWKLAYVFKCLTDTVVLDDFKTALDRLKQYKLESMGQFATFSAFDHDGPAGTVDRRFSDAVNKRLELARKDSRCSPAQKWDTDVEALEFCTVPANVYQKDERLSRVSDSRSV